MKELAEQVRGLEKCERNKSRSTNSLRKNDFDFGYEKGIDAAADLIANSPELAELRRDAVAWRTLMNCSRLRVMGSAGMGNDDNYRHLGLEMWTIHPDQTTNARARMDLVEFVEKAAAIDAARGEQGK